MAKMGLLSISSCFLCLAAVAMAEITIITDATKTNASVVPETFERVLYPPQHNLHDRCPDYEEVNANCRQLVGTSTVTKSPVKCNCRFYYECNKGYLEKYSCLENHAFNPRISSCDLPRNLPKDYKFYCPYLPNQWCPC